MSTTLYYSLNVEKGLRGNIGKMTTVQKKSGEAYQDMMLFLVANGDMKTANQLSQIVNVHFPEAAFSALEAFEVGDYVRVHFDRIDLAKKLNDEKGDSSLSLIIQPNNIELLKKAEKRKAVVSTAQVQQKKKGWGR